MLRTAKSYMNPALNPEDSCSRLKHAMRICPMASANLIRRPWFLELFWSMSISVRLKV